MKKLLAWVLICSLLYSQIFPPFLLAQNLATTSSPLPQNVQEINTKLTEARRKLLGPQKLSDILSLAATAAYLRKQLDSAQQQNHDNQLEEALRSLQKATAQVNFAVHDRIMNSLSGLETSLIQSIRSGADSNFSMSEWGTLQAQWPSLSPQIKDPAQTNDSALEAKKQNVEKLIALARALKSSGIAWRQIDPDVQRLILNGNHIGSLGDYLISHSLDSGASRKLVRQLSGVLSRDPGQMAARLNRLFENDPETYRQLTEVLAVATRSPPTGNSASSAGNGAPPAGQIDRVMELPSDLNRDSAPPAPGQTARPPQSASRTQLSPWEQSRIALYSAILRQEFLPASIRKAAAQNLYRIQMPIESRVVAESLRDIQTQDPAGLTEQRKLVEEYAKASAGKNKDALKNAEAALKQFYAQHPLVGEYSVKSAQYRADLLNGLRLGLAPDHTQFTPQDLGFANLPPGSQVSKETNQGHEGFLFTFTKYPKDPDLISLFESFDKKLQIETKKGAGGDLLTITRFLDAKGNVLRQIVRIQNSAKRADETIVQLNQGKDHAIDFQSLVPLKLLSGAEAEKLSFFAKDLYKQEIVASPPTLQKTPDGKNQLSYRTSKDGTAVTHVLYIDKDGSIVHYASFKNSDGTDNTNIRVCRGLAGGICAVKEEFQSITVMKYDPNKLYSEISTGRNPVKRYARGAEVPTQGVSYTQETWDPAFKQYRRTASKKTENDGFWDELTKESAWTFQNVPIVKQVGWTAGFATDRIKDIAYPAAGLANFLVSSLPFYPTDMDDIAYQDVSTYQMPAASALIKDLPTRLMGQLKADMGKDYEPYRAWVVEKYRNSLLKTAMDPQAVFQLQHGNFNPGDEELGRFLISGEAGYGFMGAGREFASRAASSQSISGTLGNGAMAAFAYGGDFMVQMVPFKALETLGSLAKAAAEARGASFAIRAGNRVMQTAELSQSAYFKAIMAQQALDLGKSISHQEKDEIYAAMAQLTALAFMPGGDHELGKKMRPRDVRGPLDIAREAVTTSQIAGLAGSAVKLINRKAVILSSDMLDIQPHFIKGPNDYKLLDVDRLSDPAERDRQIKQEIGAGIRAHIESFEPEEFIFQFQNELQALRKKGVSEEAIKDAALHRDKRWVLLTDPQRGLPIDRIGIRQGGKILTDERAAAIRQQLSTENPAANDKIEKSIAQTAATSLPGARERSEAPLDGGVRSSNESMKKLGGFPESPADSRIFDRRREFPNYFLPEEYRNASPDSIPKEVVERQTQLLEQAVASVLRRVSVPMVKPGAQQAVMERYFDYVSPILRAEADGPITVMASGGVVRSVIGYLDHLVRKRAGQDPLVSSEQVLRDVIADKSDLPGLLVRGVGSDWDILLKVPEGPKKQALVDRLAQKAVEATNSAETRYGMRNERGALKRSLFTVGDVKEYDRQTERSTRQGGSTIDFLAFDVDAGKFVEPPNMPGIVEDLVRGVASYIEPEQTPDKPSAIEDAAKQTIRGLRRYLELPFLGSRDDARLRGELTVLLEQIQQGKLPSSKAIEQFDKMIRNQRDGGAHNRFYRASLGSIEALALEVAEAVRKHTNKTAIPEFVDHFPLDHRGNNGAELNGLPESMVTHSLGNEKFYHGTPSAENGLAILRGGLFISKDSQGRAALGRGAYSHPQISVAQGYAGSNGVVFELTLKRGKRINILDWDAHKDSPEIQEIQRQAAAQGRDVFEYLAKDHGIDIILTKGHVLIENAEAVQFPEGVKGLILPYAHAVQDMNMPVENRIQAYKTYANLYNYASALNENDMPEPRAIGSNLIPAIDAQLKSYAAQIENDNDAEYYSLSRAYGGYSNLYRSAVDLGLNPNESPKPEVVRLRFIGGLRAKLDSRLGVIKDAAQSLDVRRKAYEAYKHLHSELSYYDHEQSDMLDPYIVKKELLPQLHAELDSVAKRVLDAKQAIDDRIKTYYEYIALYNEYYDLMGLNNGFSSIEDIREGLQPAIEAELKPYEDLARDQTRDIYDRVDAFRKYEKLNNDYRYLTKSGPYAPEEERSREDLRKEIVVAIRSALAPSVRIVEDETVALDDRLKTYESLRSRVAWNFQYIMRDGDYLWSSDLHSKLEQKVLSTLESYALRARDWRLDVSARITAYRDLSSLYERVSRELNISPYDSKPENVRSALVSNLQHSLRYHQSPEDRVATAWGLNQLGETDAMDSANAALLYYYEEQSGELKLGTPATEAEILRNARRINYRSDLLQKMEPIAKTNLQALSAVRLALVKDPSYAIRKQAALILGRVGTPEAINALLQAAYIPRSNGPPRFFLPAIEALGQTSHAGSNAAAFLERILLVQDQSPRSEINEAKSAAIQTIRKLRLDTPSIRQSLARIASSDPDYVNPQSMGLGSPQEEAIETLVSLGIKIDKKLLKNILRPLYKRDIIFWRENIFFNPVDAMKLAEVLNPLIPADKGELDMEFRGIIKKLRAFNSIREPAQRLLNHREPSSAVNPTETEIEHDSHVIFDPAKVKITREETAAPLYSKEAGIRAHVESLEPEDFVFQFQAELDKLRGKGVSQAAIDDAALHPEKRWTLLTDPQRGLPLDRIGIRQGGKILTEEKAEEIRKNLGLQPGNTSADHTSGNRFKQWLEIPGYLYRKLISWHERPLPPKETKPKIVSFQSLLELGNKDDLRIEIGAADNPYCESCLQVDLYRSFFDIAYRDIRAKGSNLDPKDFDELLALADLDRKTKPWAVNRAGIVADAKALPFKNSSVSLIISRNFPWFGPAATPDIIKPILESYYRVLKKDGAVVLLAGLDFTVHKRIARELGFTISEIRQGPRINNNTPIESAGIVLTKGAWDAGNLSRLKAPGYYGVFGLEGGEGDIGNHDSYVVIDTAKAKVVREETVPSGYSKPEIQARPGSAGPNFRRSLNLDLERLKKVRTINVVVNDGALSVPRIDGEVLWEQQRRLASGNLYFGQEAQLIQQILNNGGHFPLANLQGNALGDDIGATVVNHVNGSDTSHFVSATHSELNAHKYGGRFVVEFDPRGNTFLDTYKLTTTLHSEWGQTETEVLTKAVELKSIRSIKDTVTGKSYRIYDESGHLNDIDTRVLKADLASLSHRTIPESYPNIPDSPINNPIPRDRAQEVLARIEEQKSNGTFNKRGDKDVAAELESHLLNGYTLSGDYYRVVDPEEKFDQWAKNPGGMPPNSLYTFAALKAPVVDTYGHPGRILVKIKGKAVPYYRPGVDNTEVLLYEIESVERVPMDFKSQSPARIEIGSPKESYDQLTAQAAKRSDDSSGGHKARKEIAWNSNNLRQHYRKHKYEFAARMGKEPTLNEYSAMAKNLVRRGLDVLKQRTGPESSHIVVHQKPDGTSFVIDTKLKHVAIFAIHGRVEIISFFIGYPNETIPELIHRLESRHSRR